METTVLEAKPARSDAPDGRVRLLVAGSLMDDVDFVPNVEDLGAIVVTVALRIPPPFLSAYTLWS